MGTLISACGLVSSALVTLPLDIAYRSGMILIWQQWRKISETDVAFSAVQTLYILMFSLILWCSFFIIYNNLAMDT
jgi:hypothetical protein